MGDKQQFSFWYFFITLAVLLVLQTYLLAPRAEVVDYSMFKTLVNQKLVTNLLVGHETITGEIKPDGVKLALSEARLKEIKYEGQKNVPFTTIRVEDPKLTEDLETAGITYRGEVSSTWLPTLLSWVVPVVLFFLVWSFLINKVAAGSSGLMQIGKSKAKVFIEQKTGVTFADVEGIDEAKEELVEVVEFLKNPGKYQRLGGHIPKGVLLLGPPGTGKTLLARAVAGEAGVPFFSISGSDFVEMFVGVGAARVRDLFAQAVKTAPSIIFIDELDALGKARGMNILIAMTEREQTSEPATRRNGRLRSQSRRHHYGRDQSARDFGCRFITTRPV